LSEKKKRWITKKHSLSKKKIRTQNSHEAQDEKKNPRKNTIHASAKNPNFSHKNKKKIA
jgi:hypothetical protein